MKLSYTSISGLPFCDYLNLTVPSFCFDGISSSLTDLFDSAGLSTFDDGLTYQLDSKVGAFKYKKNSVYITLSASGGILQHFRDLGLYDQFISILLEYPHKITRLDATADYFVPYAPDVIKAFKIDCRANRIALTRKSLSSSDINYYFGINQQGDETGTIYLGKRNTHSVFGKIYDKSYERYCRGITDTPQTIRVELTLKADTGVSLRDVHNPESVFYHYASRTIVHAPPHFTGWTPNGSGYELGKQQDLFTPAGKILNIFKFSVDFARAFKIAQRAYPTDALDVLIAQFRIAFQLRQQSASS